MRFLLAFVALLLPSSAQQAVNIRVDASKRIGPAKPIASYFGYDEPNYTYTPNGKKLIRELAESTYAPVYFRTHNLLTTGDGKPALKWGSTNAYTEDANGNPVYDWTITDKIFDAYIEANAKPFVEIGFMPKALSIKPEPYTHDWPKTPIDGGWAYPPKSWEKWGELVKQWVKHCVERYGEDEVNTWYWEVWNEPDIHYWQAERKDYFALYAATVKAVKSVAPKARVGGPAVTGPSAIKANDFLVEFIGYVQIWGLPLDFLTYHAKGKPTIVDGHVRMGIAKDLTDVNRGMEIIHSFPQFRNLPIILSESDPEGCAACSVRTHPQNAYRNGTLYPSYTALMLKSIYELNDSRETNIEGMLTWAFEFEGQPYFDGFRDLATNGIDKPILNFFRMAGMLRGDRVSLSSSGSMLISQMMAKGVTDAPNIDALATTLAREINVLTWNYHDDDVPAPPSPVSLTVLGIPPAIKHVQIRHYRIDQTHSNSYTAWKAMGSPQQPTPEQYAKLEAAGQLELLESPKWILNDKGRIQLKFTLPRHAVSLVQVTW